MSYTKDDELAINTIRTLAVRLASSFPTFSHRALRSLFAPTPAGS